MKLTTQQQNVLKELAREDLDYSRLTIQLENLEEKKALEVHKDSLAEVRADGAVALASQTDLEKQVKKLEKDIAVLEADRRSTDALLYSGRVTSEKQIQSIKDELGAIRKRKYGFEDDLLNVMEKLETVAEELEGLVTRGRELESQVEDLQQRYDAASGELLRQQAEKKAAIGTLLQQMPPKFIEIYKSMWKQYINGPIATLEGDTCSGCNMQLPVIDVQDIRGDIASGEITYCTQCNIMLI